ncbi:MAG TPA: phage holin family protein [Pyrinomonadaceae bacterium]|nr:phage holin family protein [Pyrinomonadaceae bacterium]
MAASATSAKMVAANSTDTGENLTSLLGKLGDDVVLLLDTKLSLLKVEIKDEANEFARDGIMIGVGGVIAAVGFALLNVALAFAISTFLANSQLSQAARYAIGFVSAGSLYLIVGGIIVLAMKSRLAKQSLVPNRTVAELRKDKEWLTKEL